jgi:hypothetical protein
MLSKHTHTHTLTHTHTHTHTHTEREKLIAYQFIRSKFIDCVGNFSHDAAGTSGTQRDIAFSQLAVKGLKGERNVVK